MSPFFWRVVWFFSFVFFLFVITTIVLTLVVVYQIQDDPESYNKSILKYVEVANWIYVGFFTVTIFTALVVSPFIYKYTRRKPTSLAATGLKPVPPSKKK